MHHIDGIDRDQITMFPEALDDYIQEDNPVRFIDAFVRNLDLSSLGFQRVIHAGCSMEKPHLDGSCGKPVVVIDNCPEYISPCDGSCPIRSHNGYWSPVMPENEHPFEKMCQKII